MTFESRYVVLRSPLCSVVLTDDDRVPVVVHWGARLPDGVEPSAIDALLEMPLAHGSIDELAPVSLVPERSRAWQSGGGLDVHRVDGSAWAPRLVRTSSEHDESSLTWTGADPDAGISLTIRAALDGHGVLSVDTTVANEGADELVVDSLAPALPVPSRAVEALSLTGRWAKEMQPNRHRLSAGALVLENRRGRTSHETSPTIFVGTPAFAEESGEVWAMHLAWSGNHASRAEGISDGRRFVSSGELLLPGELRLRQGQSYSSPTLLAAYSGTGLIGISDAFHARLRARPSHPRSPRPVILNTWEAVYFRHDVAELCRLAGVAASVGVERYVLDDGWFRGRNDDTTSLGDWYVDSTKYPNGLGELVDHVTGLGLQFGLWVEPEMVNPDSDLYRAHPDWALGIQGQPLALGRHQLVLDLGRPEVSAYLLERLDALLTDHAISYLKWDMNRDLVAAGGAEGAAGVHAQTVALYALLDELRRRHPTVEIESCSSGGARVDLGIVERTDRFWTSDCNDALERQQIQRTFSYLIPPELMGAHVGPTWSHTTARTHTLPFRAATAMFGHLGFEWDLASATDEDRAGVARTIAVHKELRPLLHSGRVIRVDHPDPAAYVHGVVAQDRTEALFAYVSLSSSDWSMPLPVRLPGLDPERRYRVERLTLPGAQWDPGRRHPAWYDEGLEADGALLAQVGIRLGIHVPEMATLLRVTS